MTKIEDYKKKCANNTGNCICCDCKGQRAVYFFTQTVIIKIENDYN